MPCRGLASQVLAAEQFVDADDPDRTVYTDGSVHEPVQSKAPASSRPATVHNVARSVQPTAGRANSQTRPRGVGRIILLLDVRGGGLDDCRVSTG